MKKLTFILSILIFPVASSCSNNSNDNDVSQENNIENEMKNIDVSLFAELTDRGYYMIGGPNPDTLVGGPNPDSTIVYHTNLQLINNSKDSITFISMSCSHEDMYIVEDSTKLRVHPYYMCWANFPVVVTLAPEETYEKSIMIRPIEDQLSQDEITTVRSIIGDMTVLVPGIGAQGGDLEPIVKTFGDNAIVSVGRDIAYSQNPQARAKHYQELINKYR